MASRTTAILKPPVRISARFVMDQAVERYGFDVLIYCTYRSPEEQARLYRKSRRLHQIKRKAEALIRMGYPHLAEVLMGVGPQSGKIGRHVTFAGPGESWHQYGEAFDAVPMVGGKPQWSRSAHEWEQYGLLVMESGLEWAGDWQRFKEFPHAQLCNAGNPLKVLPRETVLNPKVLI